MTYVCLSGIKRAEKGEMGDGESMAAAARLAKSSHLPPTKTPIRISSADHSQREREGGRDETDESRGKPRSPRSMQSKEGPSQKS